MTTPADQRAALAGPGSGRADRAHGWPAGRPARPVDRFGGLLLILVFTYVLSAFTYGELISAVQVVLFLAVVLLALRTGRLQHRTVRMVAAGLLVGSVAAAIIQLAAPGTPAAGAANLWTALVLLVAVVLVVRRILSRPEITLQSIYGAISAYMILGLMFAAVYAAMYHFGGETFFANGQPGNTKTFQYFSFTTLTTLGYGDLHRGREQRPGHRRAGGDDRPDLPGHPGRPAGGRLPRQLTGGQPPAPATGRPARSGPAPGGPARPAWSGCGRPAWSGRGRRRRALRRRRRAGPDRNRPPAGTPRPAEPVAGPSGPEP